LGMARQAAGVLHALIREPIGQVARPRNPGHCRKTVPGRCALTR
jgi:hypothetical protein